MSDIEPSKITSVQFGGHSTPQQLLAEALGEAHTYEEVVIVIMDKDKDCRVGWSTGTHLTYLGLLSFATNQIAKDWKPANE